VAGPLTIQRVPRGLLGFLGLRGSGQLPSELSPTIAGVVDATVLYARDDFRWARAAEPAANTSWLKYATQTVPQGEIWVVCSMWAVAGTGAAVTIQALRPALRRADGGLFDNYITNEQQVPVAINSDVRLGWSFPWGQLILAPGDIIGLALQGVAGGNASVSFGVEYYRMPI